MMFTIRKMIAKIGDENLNIGDENLNLGDENLNLGDENRDQKKECSR